MDTALFVFNLITLIKCSFFKYRQWGILKKNIVMTDNENWSIGKSAILTDLGICINHYRLHTVGLFACIKVGVKLNNEVVYPDMIVMINTVPGKSSY